MTVSVFYELVNYGNQIGSVTLYFKYLHFDEILLLIFFAYCDKIVWYERNSKERAEKKWI